MTRYVRLTRDLVERGYDVRITGGPSEERLAAAVAARAGLPRRAVTVGLGLVELAQLVQRSRLVVCCDTGLAHLATAYDTPSVVLFGPVSPSRWGPPDEPWHRALWHGTPGDPHGATPEAGLLAITADEVLDAVAVVESASARAGRAHAPGRSLASPSATSGSAVSEFVPRCRG